MDPLDYIQDLIDRGVYQRVTIGRYEGDRWLVWGHRKDSHSSSIHEDRDQAILNLSSYKLPSDGKFIEGLDDEKKKLPKPSKAMPKPKKVEPDDDDNISDLI